MIERVQRRSIVIPSLVFSLIATLMLLKELPVLKDHPHFYFYVVGRLLFILSNFVCLTLAILQVEFIFLYYPIVFFVISLFYECHGEYFQPNYWLAYMQVTTLFPFIFYLDKRLLIGLMGTGLILFDIIFLSASQRYIDMGSFSKEFFADIFAGTVISTAIAYISADVFISEKMKKNQIYQRFIDLGKNMSSIAHDIKGMISGPCTYTDILYEKVTTGTISQDDAQLMNYLKEDVYAVRDFVMEMNLLVSSHITDKDNVIALSDVIKSIRRVFKSKIKGIKIELVGDITLKTKVDYLNRILINSIVNSCESLHKNNVKDGRITLYCEENLLGIADNSGEALSNEILKKLNNPYITFTSKTQGSGMGVLLIKDYINAIGGKFKYSNHTNGVNLKITFPKKMVLKSDLTNVPKNERTSEVKAELSV